jgi:phage tail protein X
MRLATLQADEDLAQLTRRVYRSRAKGGLADAEKAILKANPQLRDRDRLTPGTIVVIPDVPGATPTTEATSIGGIAANLLSGAQQQIKDLRESVQPGLNRQEQAAKNTLEQLRLRELQELAKGNPELAKRLPEITKTAEENLKRLAVLTKTQQAAFDELAKDLQRLVDSLGGPQEARPTRPAPGDLRAPRRRPGD